MINKTSEGEMTITNEEPGSIVAENWLDQFLPALKLHLEEKKWLSIWIQHLADEPNHRP